MFATLETFHFEMSELNTLVGPNTAESKKEKRERGEKRRKVRVGEKRIVNILEQKKKKKWGKGRRERSH